MTSIGTDSYLLTHSLTHSYSLTHSLRIDDALEAIVQRRRARAVLQQQLDDEIASYCFDVPRKYTASYAEPVEYVTAVQPMTIINPINSVPMVVTISKEQEVEEEYNYLQTGDDFDNYDIDNYDNYDDINDNDDNNDNNNDDDDNDDDDDDDDDT
jgi:hypothetical protein